MTKEDKKKLKEILANKELNRLDARWLMEVIFNNSYFELSHHTNIKPMWLKEQLTAIRVFTKDSQEKILQASFKLTQKKPKIVLKND